MSKLRKESTAEMPAQQLETAFAAFNSASSTLTEQYASLERRIGVLNEQLLQAHSQRDKELAEKQRLAQRLSGMLSALPGGVLFFAGNGRLLDWNKKAVELLGIELQGCSWQEIADHCFAEGVLSTGEVILANSRRVSLSIESLPDDAGKIVLLSDVTESRNLQEGIKHKERLSEIGQMVGKLAHQIRTPLASAFLYLSRLRKAGKQKSSDAIAEKLHQCLSNVQQTLDDLLLYVRGQNPVMSYCDVNTVLSAVKTTFAGITFKNAVTLECQDKTKNRYIYVNRNALEGAILNLLNNAAQADASHIVVSFEPASEKLRIIVEDNGSGIKQEHRNRIFDAFYTTRVTGTGLGLAIVKTVVELHGGEVKLDAECHNRTRFVITIPDYTQQNFISSSTALNQTFSIN